MRLALDPLRRYAVARSLFPPITPPSGAHVVDDAAFCNAVDDELQRMTELLGL